MHAEHTGISPPAIFLASIGGMLALEVLMSGPIVVPTPLNLLGLVPVFSGVVLHAWATRRFRRSGTTVAALGPPSALVVDGAYAFTRNPMYLAGIFILVGFGVVLGTVTPFLGPPLFAWWVRNGYIVREERMLEERFGFEYLQYRSRVRRWI